MKGMGVRQEVHQVNLLTRFVKYSRLVTSVRDVVPFFEEGIQNAQTGIFGPVFFSVHKLALFFFIKKNLTIFFLFFPGTYFTPSYK
jgi:hypothetical protein